MTELAEYHEAARAFKDERYGHHGAVGQIRHAFSEHAYKEQMDLDEFKYSLSYAFSPYESLLYATNESAYEIEKGEKLKPWTNKSHSVQVRKPFGKPHIIKSEVENAAADYLERPFRVDQLDRTFVDALMASEIFAYLDSPFASQMKSGSFWWAFLSNLVLAGILYWISDGAGWSKIVGFLLLALPFLPLFTKHRSPAAKLFMAMRDAYLFLDSPVTSISELRAAVDRARGAGVVWPGPLYVLLEDIARRRSSI